MADTSASTLGRRSTRPTNADAHPGRAIQKRKRRTKEEIAPDKALLEETRNEKNGSKLKVSRALQSLKTEWLQMMPVPKVPTHEKRKVCCHVSFFTLLGY